MKVFWAILIGAFLIASAIVFTSGNGDRGSGSLVNQARLQDSSVSSRPARVSALGPDMSDAAVSRDSFQPEPGRSDSQDADEPEELAVQPDAQESLLENGESIPSEEVAELIPAPPLNLDELLGIEREPGQITPEMAIADSAIDVEGGRSLSQQRTAEFAELALQAVGSVEEASRLAGSISPDDEVRTDERALVIGRVTIPGSGSAEDPYELPWGVLISAIRTYNPRLELNDLPAWAASLDERYVRLTGFAFLPVVASETDEILLMLNPWDGCHMGAPPTPYDSVEVLLDRAVNLGGRNGFVTVTGKFRVDPYLIRNWLVSLYTMEDARLEFSGS